MVVVLLVTSTFSISAASVSSNGCTLTFNRIESFSNLYTGSVHSIYDYSATDTTSGIKISCNFNYTLPVAAYRIPIYLDLNSSYSNVYFKIRVNFLSRAESGETDVHRLYDVSTGQVIATGTRVNDDYVEFTYSGAISKNIKLDVNAYLNEPTISLDYFVHIELTDFQFVDNSATGQIIQNQNNNTDKILDGDEDLDSSGDTGKVSGSIDNVDDAKDGALGGKSDKEIQAEINSALDSDKIGLDFTKAGRISNFFDNLLNAFGSGYKTLLMLSLSLGLAGFLIGRRWA